MTEVRARWRDLEVVTDLVPRTEVERWQMQDRIRAALALVEPGAAITHFFLRGPQLAFRARWAAGRRDALEAALRAAPWR